MNTIISNPDETRSIHVIAKKDGFRAKSPIKIKCFFDQKLVIPFADALRKGNIPAEEVTIDVEKQPSGVIKIEYFGEPPKYELLADQARSIFENFCTNLK